MGIPTHDARTKAFLRQTAYREIRPGALVRYMDTAPQIDLTATAIAINAGKMFQREQGKGRDLSVFWHACIQEAGAAAYPEANLLEPVVDILAKTWEKGPALKKTMDRLAQAHILRS